MDGTKDAEQTDRFEVRSIDLPPDLPSKAKGRVCRYSVPLFLNEKLAGSGTFIKCGRVHGILTAHHVIHNPHDRTRRFDFTWSSPQKLELAIADTAHRFAMEMRYLHCVDVGVPKDDYSGPDLAVIVLPNADSKIGEIKARSLFYDLSVQRERRKAEALINDGFWVTVGNPVKLERIQPASHGFAYVIDSIGIVACTYVTKRFDEGEFDFLHLAVDYSLVRELPENLGGMSGGGVWRIPLLKKKDDPPSKIYLGDELLAGVAFFQTEVKDNSCEIRCHAARSIYERVYEALSALESRH